MAVFPLWFCQKIDGQTFNLAKKIKKHGFGWYQFNKVRSLFKGAKETHLAAAWLSAFLQFTLKSTEIECIDIISLCAIHLVKAILNYNSKVFFASICFENY